MRAFAARSIPAPVPLPLARRVADEKSARETGRWWILGFIAFELLMQLALLRPEFQPFRKYIRASSFGANLFMLFAITGKAKIDNFGWLLTVVLGIIAMGLFHPETYSIFTSFGVLVWYLSIFAPVFWVSRLRINLDSLRWLMVTFWVFHAISSVFGVLQTYFPGQFQGAISAVFDETPDYVASLTIRLENGETVFRPMGLTDAPGGAAFSGMYTFLLGLALMLDRKNWIWRAIICGGMAAGLYCLLLSQVRVCLVVLVICITVFLLVLSHRRQGAKVTATLLLIAAIAFLGALWALSVGREAVVGRLITLVEDDPLTVYRGNRGFFMEHLLRVDIWEHPLGSGLGRWGMMYMYFGDPSGSIPSLWAEINWTAWCYDGGMLLMLLMLGVMVFMIYRAFIISGEKRSVEWCVWGGILCAYNVGFLAMCFCSCPLLSQFGIEYFLINAVLYTSWQQHRNSLSTRTGALA